MKRALKLFLIGLVALCAVVLLTSCSHSKLISYTDYDDWHSVQLISVNPGVVGEHIHGLEFKIHNGTRYRIYEVTVKVLQSDHDQYFAVPLVVQPYLDPGQDGIFYLDADLAAIRVDEPLAGYLESAKRTWYASVAWHDRAPILTTASYRNWFQVVAFRSHGTADN